MEGLIYLDGRFNLQAVDDGFLIEASLLVDVFGTIEKAAAYYEARDGRLEPSHGGMHMLWKRVGVETKSEEGAANLAARMEKIWDDYQRCVKLYTHP